MTKFNTKMKKGPILFCCTFPSIGMSTQLQMSKKHLYLLRNERSVPSLDLRHTCYT